MAHLKKHPTSGHLLKSASGHLVKDCGAPPCSECTEAATVSFTATATGAYGCDPNWSVSGTLTWNGSEYEYSDIFDGTYTLNCIGPDNWTFEINPGPVDSECAEPQCYGTETGIELDCVTDGNGDGAPSGSFTVDVYDYCAGVGSTTTTVSVTITPL